MKTFLRELPLIAIILIPFAYLWYLWGTLPERVPVHWNIEGNVDRYGSKSELLLIPIFLPVLIYVILLVVPVIDPKKKIAAMGVKYHNLKFVLTAFMSALAVVILYTTAHQAVAHTNVFLLCIGILYLLLGNYFKTIRANYFIGIRTPWTLENEEVWKKTHALGGKLWFGGGLIIVLSSIFLNARINFVVFMIVTGILVLIPIVYSYVAFRNVSKTS